MSYVAITPEQLGHQLKAQRKAKGLTQKQAAQHVGLYSKTISRLERDPATASIESLFKLLSALELELTIREIPADSRGESW